jgi:cation transport regulator
MPYNRNADLPKAVRNVLPERAQEIYRKAFNNAVKQYKDPKKRRVKESADVTSRRVAWSAVRKLYKKVGTQWVKKGM